MILTRERKRIIASVFVVFLGLLAFVMWAAWLSWIDCSADATFKEILINWAIGVGGAVMTIVGIIGGLLIWGDSEW